MSTALNGLPDPVGELCAMLAQMEGVEVVAIGGSRAAGTADVASDWDIGVYYRCNIDLALLATYGKVHPPGSWGRIMNGGAWLSLGGTKVDVLLRDLVGHDHRPVSFLVYLWLAMEQQRNGTAVQISYKDLAENLGVSKSSAQAALGWLVRRKLLAANKETVTATPKYSVLTPWKDTARRRA